MSPRPTSRPPRFASPSSSFYPASAKATGPGSSGARFLFLARENHFLPDALLFLASCHPWPLLPARSLPSPHCPVAATFRWPPLTRSISNLGTSPSTRHPSSPRHPARHEPRRERSPDAFCRDVGEGSLFSSLLFSSLSLLFSLLLLFSSLSLSLLLFLLLLLFIFSSCLFFSSLFFFPFLSSRQSHSISDLPPPPTQAPWRDRR